MVSGAAVLLLIGATSAYTGAVVFFTPPLESYIGDVVTLVISLVPVMTSRFESLFVSTQLDVD